MSVRVFLHAVIILCFLQLCVRAQTIQGEILDKDNNHALSDVSVSNVYTGISIRTAADGKFMMPVSKGQLLEFNKMGYKTERVRIPDGFIPPYFKIIMHQGIDLPEYNAVLASSHDYKSDSIRFHDIYGHELDFPKMSTLDVINHPFSALSKKNQGIWAFQKQYEYYQEQKYIDYTFNEKLIKQLTGLQGDSALNYIRRYRPTYQQLRSMDEYTLYSYIKHSVYQYRYYGHSPSRNAQ